MKKALREKINEYWLPVLSAILLVLSFPAVGSICAVDVDALDKEPQASLFIRVCFRPHLLFWNPLLDISFYKSLRGSLFPGQPEHCRLVMPLSGALPGNILLFLHTNIQENQTARLIRGACTMGSP